MTHSKTKVTKYMKRYMITICYGGDYQYNMPFFYKVGSTQKIHIRCETLALLDWQFLQSQFWEPCTMGRYTYISHTSKMYSSPTWTPCLSTAILQNIESPQTRMLPYVTYNKPSIQHKIGWLQFVASPILVEARFQTANFIQNQRHGDKSATHKEERR